jgi:ankyrin repeat protein
MNRMLLKIACLSVLMMSSALAMDPSYASPLATEGRSVKQDLNLQLVEAALDGDTQQVEQLLTQGADVNAQNNNGKTALMTAAEWDHKKICELLLASGAHVNAQDNDDNPALTLAAINDHKEICELLIAKGADVNAQSKYGNTALMRTIIRGYQKICELLIAKA